MVARRLALANFIAFAPDGLTSVGGYPGSDEKGAAAFRTVDGKLLITPPLHYVDYAPKNCHADIAADGPWCLHRPMKLLLPDLLRLVLLAEDVTRGGADIEALVVAWNAWNNKW